MLLVAALALGLGACPEGSGTLTIVNRIAWGGDTVEIVEIFIDDAGAGTATREQLDGGSLSFQERLRVRGTPSGRHDVLVRDDSGSFYERRGVRVLAGLETVVSLTEADLAGPVTADAADVATPAGAGDLELVHRILLAEGGADIGELYVRSAGAGSYGASLLGAVTWSAGNAVRVEALVAGLYDVMAVDHAGAAYVQAGVEIVAGRTTVVTLTASDEASPAGAWLRVVNRVSWGGAPVDLVALYLDGPGASAGSGDRLEGAVLSQDESIELPVTPGGHYEILAADSAGSFYGWSGVAPASGVEAAVELAEDDLVKAVTSGPANPHTPTGSGDLEIIHRIVRAEREATIAELYVAPAGASTWGANLLGGVQLTEGNATKVQALIAGWYDVGVIDQADAYYVFQGVEVVDGRLTSLTLTLDDLEQDGAALAASGDPLRLLPAGQCVERSPRPASPGRRTAAGQADRTHAG